MTVSIQQGFELHLRSLHQQLTYAGLLEGLPSKWMNDGIVKRAMERAPVILYCKNVHLLEPKLTPIEHERTWPFGKPEALPAVTCMAEFKAFETINTSIQGHSELCIVWFQDKFALPFSDEMLAQLQTINWKKLAHDVSFDEY